MTAKIDIRTPAGKSLEGFPQCVGEESYIYTEIWPNKEGVDARVELRYSSKPTVVQLHKGDTITIEIL